VRDIESGQVIPGAKSTPGGSGGRGVGCDGFAPFGAIGLESLYPAGAWSSSLLSCEKSTRILRPIISVESRFRTAEAAASGSEKVAKP
jgi:hypothetical protein